jgi:hypothetical protein
MAHTLGARSSGTVRRVGTEWVRDGSDRCKRQIVLPPQGSPLRHFRPRTTRGPSNGDYEAYRATHLTDHATLSRRSPRDKAEPDGAARVVPCHVTLIHGALRLTRVPPLPWPVPLSRFEKCAPRSGTSSSLLSGRGPTVKGILTVRHILCDAVPVFSRHSDRQEPCPRGTGREDCDTTAGRPRSHLHRR